MKKLFKFTALLSLLVSLVNNNIYAESTPEEQRKDRMLLQMMEKDNDLTKLTPGAHQRIETLRTLPQLNSTQKNILRLIDSNFIGNESKDRDLLARLKRDGDKTTLTKKEELYLKHLNRTSGHPTESSKLTPTQHKLLEYIPLHLLQDASVMSW